MKHFTNLEIAKLFRDVGAALTVKGADQFRILAYQKAAETAENFDQKIFHSYEEDKISGMSGIGKAMKNHLDELFQRGSVRHFQEIFKGIPPAFFALLDISGIGPKTAIKLVRELKLNSRETAVSDLQTAIKKDIVAGIPGFGAKSQADLLINLKNWEKRQNKKPRLLLPKALHISRALISYLRQCPEIFRADALGSLRRRAETVGDIDISVCGRNNKKIIEHFIRYPYTKRVLEKGEATSSILNEDDAQIDLMIQPAESYGSLLVHFTGSKAHNIKLREYALKKGLSVSEYGIRKISSATISQKSSILEKFKDEKSFYQRLGLSWIPPELREDRGEISAAQNGRLPEIVKLSDIKGDLHLHGSWLFKVSHDLGSDSLEKLVLKAKSLNYEYIGISDHNPSVSKQTTKDILNVLKRRLRYIEQIKERIKYTRVKIVNMLEVDILSDGSLALPEGGFDYIDAAIVSLHSRFDQPRAEITQRVLRGLNHPKVRILAHPTCRMINRRPGADLDFTEILPFCRQNQIALEINSYPLRLDLPEDLVYNARREGNKFIINTDSHSAPEMELMRYGVDVARRGWCEKDDILNTLGYNEFRSWLLK